jgi:hypothetical protein
MVHAGISTEWLLKGFKYDLETTVRPKTVEYYTGEIRRFLRWAESAGLKLREGLAQNQVCQC